MAGITFSEVEIKKLILALAGSKGAAPMSEAADEAQESPAHEADPKDASEDAAEGESPDKSAGAPHGESTKAMLERKLKEKRDA